MNEDNSPTIDIPITPKGTNGKGKMVTCQKCNSFMPFDSSLFSLQKHDLLSALYGETVFDVGLSCSNCHTFYHAAYETDKLRRQRYSVELEKRAVEHEHKKRSYQKRFSRFQDTMRELLSANPTNSD